MEQAILRNAPAVYQRGAWAAENVGGKPRLAAMLGEFRRLRRLLRDAKCKSRCRESGSKRRPRWMTLEQAEGGYSPYPRFWCHKHEPSDYVYMSWKMRIELEAMRLFKELKYRKVLCKFWRPWELKRVRNYGSLCPSLFRDSSQPAHTTEPSAMLKYWVGVEPTSAALQPTGYTGFLSPSASNCVQLEGIRNVRHCLFGKVALPMNVVQRRASVCMTELLFCYFRRVASVHDERRDGMPEGIHPVGDESGEQLPAAPPDEGDTKADDGDSDPPISTDAFTQESFCSKGSRSIAQGTDWHHKTHLLK